MEKEVLETVLKRSARNATVDKVLEVSHEPALNKGENYMSDIIRVRAKVLLGNGRTSKRSYIIKKKLEESAMNEAITKYDVFKTEAMLYNVIMKEMEFLMEEFEDTEDVLWCNLYDHGPSFLLLEDLKASGFLLGDRKTGLNLDEGLFVLHHLSRFHAMAKILEVRGIITRDMVKPYLPTDDKAFIKGIVHSGLCTFSKAIKETWGPNWEEVGEKLNMPFISLVERFNELRQLDETKFNVLNHGDIWPNNIMFKYNWMNSPVALRFLDFQLCHYNTCCWDLTFFLYYSMVPSIRRDNLQRLMECYHNSLTKTLDRYGYTELRPTINELSMEMNRLSFFGYCMLFSEYPPLVTDLSDGYEIGQVMDSNAEGGYSVEVYKDKRLIDKLGPDLLQFTKKYF